MVLTSGNTRRNIIWGAGGDRDLQRQAGDTKWRELSTKETLP